MQVVFGGFSAEALSQRILDCKSKIILTSSAVLRGAKVIKLKDIVDDALARVVENGFTVGKICTYGSIDYVEPPHKKWKVMEQFTACTNETATR